MADYPAAIPTFDEPANTLAGPPTHEDLHLQLSGELGAALATLGVSPQGGYGTVADRILYIARRLPMQFGPGTPGGGTIAAAGNVPHTVCQLIIPAQSVAGVLLVWAQTQVAPVSEVIWSTYKYEIQRNNPSGYLGATSESFSYEVGDGNYISMQAHGATVLEAGVSPLIATVVTPLEAAGSLTYSADSNVNRITALFIPTP